MDVCNILPEFRHNVLESLEIFSPEFFVDVETEPVTVSEVDEYDALVVSHRDLQVLDESPWNDNL